MREAAPILMPFPTQAQAIAYMKPRLAPFCRVIQDEVDHPSGMQVDLGLRLIAFPDILIPIEVKPFEEGRIVPLPDAIAQASSYAEIFDCIAVVGPFCAQGARNFVWHTGSLGSAMLVAAQFNVGSLYFAPNGGRIAAGLAYAENPVATFLADGTTKLHPNIKQLLKPKNRWGSKSWRRT
jgi:hypothetical protein